MPGIMNGTRNPHKGVKYNRIVDAEAGEPAKSNAVPSRPSFSFLQTLPKWLLVLIACPILILGVAFFTHTPAGAKHQHVTGPQLAIPLHPEDHIYRGPGPLQFDWTITSGMAAPDGVERQVYLVNGQFPGPTIEARGGDRIMVTVHNNLTDEGISLHWHGLRMEDYNAMDGAVGFTQCPIAPGTSFMYSFLIHAEETGTFWWHSHSQVQRGDGLYGGLVVHQHGDPKALQNQYLLMVGDWFHRTQSDVLAWFADAVSQGQEPVPDSMLVNGRGHFDCRGADPERPLNCTDTKTKEVIPLFNERRHARLRVVNVGTVAGVSLAVEGANMQPMEVDGAWPVHAEIVDSIGVLYPGERVDINMTWIDDTIKEPKLGLYLDEENFNYVNPTLKAAQSFAAVPESVTAWTTSDHVTPLKETGRGIDLRSVTSAKEIPEEIKDSQHTIVLYVRTMIESHFGNKPLGHFNHTTWKPQDQPLLSLNRSSWDDNQLVPYIDFDPSKPTVVTLVINNRDDGAHPMHLHGNSFYVLSTHEAEGRTGWGSYNPFDPDEKPPAGLNLKNPVRKDTVAIPRRGHVIIRFVADNPGLWMLHCHMLVHMGTGMVAGLHVGSEDEHHLKVDNSTLATCQTKQKI